MARPVRAEMAPERELETPGCRLVAARYAGAGQIVEDPPFGHQEEDHPNWRVMNAAIAGTV